MIVTSVHTYPLKSGSAVGHQRRLLEARGLKGDRRYMTVDGEGRFLTARQHPTLVRVQMRFEANDLILAAPERTELRVPLASQTSVRVRIWRSDTSARDMGDSAARWLSDYLGATVRLVYQSAADHRAIEDWPGVLAEDEVSFADGYPLLLIGSASLDALNERLIEPVAMARFRPNLVVRTTRAFAEDEWRQLRVGDCEFAAVKRCARCVLTAVDPLTGQRDPAGEPLKTLRSFRLDKAARGILFGINLIPRKLGTVSVGDPLVVLK